MVASAASQELFTRKHGYTGSDAVISEVSAVSKMRCALQCIGNDQCLGFMFNKTVCQCKMITQLSVDQSMSSDEYYYGEIYVTPRAHIIRNLLAKGEI